MFQGIVQGLTKIIEIRELVGLSTFVLERSKLFDGLQIGASVSVDGVCLTATSVSEKGVSFDLINETLTRTCLGSYRVNQRVNIERSLKAGDEIGGHLTSGHIDGKVKIIAIEEPENNRIFKLSMPENFMRYLFPKGYIALNGASLTVVEVNKAALNFSVHLIPETLRLTTFSEKIAGNELNFEVDRQTQAIVDTVLEVLQKTPLVMASSACAEDRT